MTTTAGHSFYIGPIGFFYYQVNDTGSWEPLVNIYYRIFYELWTFAYIDWLCKLEKRGVSVSAVLYPRWPPLLKIEISSNGQNCSILSQKVPKFELYKHNGELLNIYYGIFYELWTFAYFDRLCKLEKRGDEIKIKSSPLKLLSQS